MDSTEVADQNITKPNDAGTVIFSLKNRCTCLGCPTYNECMREKSERLFCLLEKSSSCSFEKKGCLCPTCPVTARYQLKKAYYCIRGNEQEQTGRTVSI